MSATSTSDEPVFSTAKLGRETRWQRYVRYWSAKEGGESLALVRMGVGFTVFITIAWLMYRHIPEVIWVPRGEGGYRNLGKGAHLVKWFGGPSASTTAFLLWTGLVSSFLVMVGAATRLSTLVCLLAYINLHRINSETSGSSDIVITNALWMLFLSRCGMTYSVDAWVKTRRFVRAELISAWPRYLMILQLVLIYCTTGLQKVSAYWLPFGDWAALYYVLQQPAWIRFDHSWAAFLFPMTQFGTAVTWVWEVTSPVILLLLWYRRTPGRGGRLRWLCNSYRLRTLWVIVGLSLHIGILVFMVVGPFSPITMSLYFAIYAPGEWRGLGGRLRQRFASASRARA